MSDIIGYAENGIRLTDAIEAASLVVPLVISFGAPFAIALGRPPVPTERFGSFTSGLFAGHVVIDFTGASACVQVNFTPFGAFRFFGIPVGELCGRMVPLEDMSDAGLGELRRRLGSTADWNLRLQLAEAFIAARLRRAPAEHPATAAAFRTLCAGYGEVPVATVAARVGSSRKQLAQRSATRSGCRPRRWRGSCASTGFWHSPAAAKQMAGPISRLPAAMPISRTSAASSPPWEASPRRAGWPAPRPAAGDAPSVRGGGTGGNIRSRLCRPGTAHWPRPTAKETRRCLLNPMMPPASIRPSATAMPGSDDRLAVRGLRLYRSRPLWRRRRVQHAELALGSSLIMLGTVRDDAYGRMVGEPGKGGGRSTYVAVADADAVYSRAKAAGAEILEQPVDRDYGSRDFICARSGRQCLVVRHLLAEGRRSGLMPGPSDFGPIRRPHRSVGAARRNLVRRNAVAPR